MLQPSERWCIAGWGIFIRFYFIHFSRLNSISIILFWENTGSASENYEVFEIWNHSCYSSMQPYFTFYLTFFLTLRSLTSRLTLPYHTLLYLTLTLPCLSLAYLTLYHTLCLTLPYFTLCLTLPYHTLHLTLP